ncbi:MAG: c-type cytochrome [Solitalea-like symbiont of Acarus siro]
MTVRISPKKRFQIFTKCCLAILLVFSANTLKAQDPANGKKLFISNCAACHNQDISKKLIGPPLKGITDQRDEAWLIEWVKDSQAMIKKGDPEAVKIAKEYNNLVMTPFPQLKDSDIKDILAYIKEASNAPIEPKGVVPATQTTNNVVQNEFPTSNVLVLAGIVVLLLAIILVLTNITVYFYRLNQAKKLENIEKGIVYVEEKPDKARFDALIDFIVNPKMTLASIFIIIIVGSAFLTKFLWNVGVDTNYEPAQPIMFSHKVHAGINEINCFTCHSGAQISKNASIPTVDFCMGCHKMIPEYKGDPIIVDGKQIDGTKEIHKLYEYAGFNPETGDYDTTKKGHPIEWIRVHNLPDFAYFNHSQHVSVAEAAIKKAKNLSANDPVCFACHGQVTDMHEIRQVQPLTMKWCIECHRATDISPEIDNKFYENMVNLHEKIKNGQKVTVSEMGGLECSKCHY